MIKRLFANLGFLLQISGLLTILPIAIGLASNETQAVIALLLACAAFFGTGFLLNALCERKELNFKGSHFLFLATFILLPLIGAIPYFYPALNLFGDTNVFDLFTNGVFESVSGFTTTGFSFIASPENLPNSIRIYRSLTELMGGVGVIFLLLAFFQSKKSLSNLSDSVGIDNVSGNLKKTYLYVFGLYSISIFVFIGLFLLMGFTDMVNTSTFVIDTLTGGFSPSATQFQQYLGAAPKFFTVILMLFGAVNFNFIYNFFIRKIKRAISGEIFMFFTIIFIGAIMVSLTGIDFFDSLYHVVSMSTSVGYNYIPVSSFSNSALSILIVLMLIGGCTFSMAGGIRVSRIISFFKITKEKIKDMLKGEQVVSETKPDTKFYENQWVLSSSIFIVLFIFTLVVFAVIFTTSGVSFSDALFEMGSALTTCGISMGATTATMAIGYKWLIIVAMTIGRVEILSFLIVAFSLWQKIPVKIPSFSTSLDWMEKALLGIADMFRVLISRFIAWIVSRLKHQQKTK